MTDGVLFRAIAQELRMTTQLVEDVAAVLCTDERFIMEFMDQFQAFDLIVQHINESAKLLERVADGEDMHAAIDAVLLALVQHRLRETIGGQVAAAA